MGQCRGVLMQSNVPVLKLVEVLERPSRVLSWG